HGSTFEHLVGPTKPVAGVVRDRATGKPLAGVRVVGRVGSQVLHDIRDIETVTDAKGHYRLTGLPKAEQYPLTAATREWAVYLPHGKERNDTEGLKPLDVDFELERGVPVRGRLIDKATGKPVPGMVEYNLLPGNPYLASRGLLQQFIYQRQFVTADGD